MKLAVATIVLLALAHVASADTPADAGPAGPAGPFVEVNLVPFAFSGYSAFAGYDPRRPTRALVYETYINPYVGYLWKPIANQHVYVNPIFGVAFSTTTSGTMSLGGQGFGFQGYVPLAFFVVGYAFD